MHPARAHGDASTSPIAFVDPRSWLVRGLRYRTQCPLGVLDATLLSRAFESVDGATVARILVQEPAGQQTELSLDEIFLNFTAA